jgi:hypothetical protein
MNHPADPFFASRSAAGARCRLAGMLVLSDAMQSALDFLGAWPDIVDIEQLV